MSFFMLLTVFSSAFMHSKSRGTDSLQIIEMCETDETGIKL